jgi:nuclear transcription Y subunit beta
MTTLGFEDYIEPLKLYLHKFRELEGEKVATGAGAGHQQKAETPSSAHNDAAGYGMYGGGSGVMMMMGQPMYGSPPAGHPQPPHQQMVMGGAKGAYGHAGGSPSSGLGRQDRV